VVEGDLGVVVEDNDAARVIDFANATMAETDVVGVAEDRADGVGHVGRFESRRRHLVQQGQERVEVVLVHDGDANVLVDQSPRGGDARESSADDHYVR
jgi:hypothetical protein